MTILSITCAAVGGVWTQSESKYQRLLGALLCFAAGVIGGFLEWGPK